MNKYERLTLYASILVCAVMSLSFRWPLDQGRITSSFGESRGDHFHDGIDMVCPDDKIYPVNRGKLVYFRDESIFPLDTVPGGGNYKVLRHEKDIYSIYMHLKGGTTGETSYNKKNLVGMIGNSGHSYAKHLHFSLLKMGNRTSINPMKLLPAYKDDKKPEIKSFLLRIGEKYVTLRDGSDIRLTRHYPLLVKIVDSISGKERLGIHRLRVKHNGREIFKTEFDSIQLGEKGLRVGKNSFDGIFDEKGYYRIPGITYRNGGNTFSIRAVDFSGNFIEKDFTCTVKLDMD